jgi:transcriptional regulator with XRE-family HTH domain
MATVSPTTDVGAQVREWRERRRLTQLELALDAGISTRHLSFVETGRSQPGRDLLLRVLDRLDVPSRERNRLLLAAGHAPAFPERALDDPDLTPVREALDRALAAHEPNPAVAFDRGWNLVAANSTMAALADMVDVDPSLLEPPVNVLRVGLHPRGLAPLIVNLGDVSAHFLDRVRRQAAMTGDAGLAALLDEVSEYPGVRRERGPLDHRDDLLGPFRMRAPAGGEGGLSFFGMFATFDTPFEVTTSELALELLFPADRATSEAMRSARPDERGGRA